MSICILFILFNGSGYLTPACYDGYELITPHSVAFVQQVPSGYEHTLYESPNYYIDYYWNAREEYCGNESRREWVAGHYSHGSYIPGHWVGGSNSWGQGWAFWSPNYRRTSQICRRPSYLSYTHYHVIPYHVRHRVHKHLKRTHNHRQYRVKHNGYSGKHKKASRYRSYKHKRTNKHVNTRTQHRVNQKRHKRTVRHTKRRHHRSSKRVKRAKRRSKRH